MKSIETATQFAGTSRRFWMVVSLMGLLLAGAMGRSLPAQEPLVDREAKIKAAYLYQFIRYVRWPRNAFANADSPILVGSIGGDPVNPYLSAIANSRSAGKRGLAYRPISNIAEAKACHILFVSDRADRKTVESIIRNLGNEPVLLVGETPSFLNSGGIISFTVVNNNVRLQLSMKSAANHQLKISSQLAKLAQIVN